MRQVIPLNYEWWYKPSFEEADLTRPNHRDGFVSVDLPHTNIILPCNYIDENSYQFVSCYKKVFSLPCREAGRRVFLQFDGVMTSASVYCNRKHAADHIGGYTPFRMEVTELVNWNGFNELTVRVDSREDPSVPPFGNVVDYLTYGGIYREVRLLITDSSMIENVRLTCPDCLSYKKRLAGRIDIHSVRPQAATLRLTMKSPEGGSVCTERQLRLEAGSAGYEISLDCPEGTKLWEPDSPALYDISAEVCGDGFSDEVKQRFGFRDCRFDADGFYLNGRKRKLIGMNRHQSFPYVGYAMPKRIQKKDAVIIKEAGLNVVRCSHYPQSAHFLDACDELGLLAVEELPGWQHIGEQAWKERSLKDINDMIARDFNHPSIILWGVRINESQDDHDFYVKTNALARSEDPTRQTGGIRYIRNSEFLEDVYTYNDFTYEGGPKVLLTREESTGLKNPVPLLVTENMGHTYPTKRFDNEQRRVEHALRHLRIMDEALGRTDLAGEISWCAFDYNTHASFGSGDKICYHGIFDIFRNPKYAAEAYSSQKDPADGIVLAPLTLGARGEKDGGGLVPFYVCTNCDYVRVYRNGKLVDDFYPLRQEYPHLPHPPVLISHLMEKESDLEMEDADAQDYRAFMKDKLIKGEMLNMRAEDMAYIAGLASKYGMSARTLYGTMVKMAGGWGDQTNNLLLEGYLAGSKVCSREIGEKKSMAGILARPDDAVLFTGEDTYDATRVRVWAVDTLGEEQPFTQECVQIHLQGPAILLGPDRFPLAGGCSAFWIRTIGEEGTVHIHIDGVYASASCEVIVRRSEIPQFK